MANALETEVTTEAQVASKTASLQLAIDQVANAVNLYHEIDTAGANYVLTADDIYRHGIINLTGVTVVSKEVTWPTGESRQILIFSDEANTQNIDIAHGTTSVALEPGLAYWVISDGTVNNLRVFSISAGGGGGVGSYVDEAGDTMTGSLGIGSGITDHLDGNAVATLLKLRGSGAEIVTGTTQGESTSGWQAERYSNNTGPPTNVFRKARGTIAAPADVIQNDIIMRLNGFARLSGAFQNIGLLDFLTVAATPSTTDRQSRAVMSLQPPAGAGASVEVARWDGNGDYKVTGAISEAGIALSAKYAQLAVANTFTAAQTISAAAAAANIFLNPSASGFFAAFYMQTGGVMRWAFRKGNTGESGSDAGSDFEIVPYNDAGTSLGAALSIARASRVANFAVAPTIAGAALSASFLPIGGGTLTGALTVSAGNIAATGGAMQISRTGDAAAAQLFIDRDVGQYGQILFRTGTSNRWLLSTTNTAEGGSNAGTDLTLQANNDAGASLGNVFSVTRATRVMDFAIAPTIAGAALSASFLPIAGGTLSGDIVFSNAIGSIHSDTADAADTKGVAISGGGTYSGTRGAYLQLWGNEHATLAGQASLSSGSTGHIILGNSGNGVVVGAPTGGAKGNGTLNAVSLYENNVSLSAKYASLALGNTFTVAQTISVSSTQTVLTLKNTQDAATGAILTIQKERPTPTVNDTLGNILFNGFDSALNATTYADIFTQLVDPTNALEDGRLGLRTMKAGALSPTLTMELGVWVGAATGGDKGANTLNADALYEAGIALSAKYAALAGASFTGAISSTGTITTTGGALAVNRIGDATAAIIQLLCDVGQLRDIISYTGAAPRWTLRMGNSVAESGSDAGSDFGLYRWTDAAVSALVLDIARATGIVNFAVAPTIAGVALSVTYAPLAGATFTGPVKVPAGLVSAPGLQVGDADTGFYSSAAGTVDLAIDGVQNHTFTAIGYTLTGASAAFTATRVSADATSPTNNTEKARGTVGSPAVIQQNDQIGTFQARGFDGTIYRTPFQLRTTVTEVTPGPAAMGARTVLNMAPIGSSSATEVMRLEHASGLSMFGANPVVNQDRGIVLRSTTIAGVASLTKSIGTRYWISDYRGGVEAVYDGANMVGTAIQYLQLAASDESTALTTGASKIKFRAPCAMKLSASALPRASLSTAQTSGSIFTVDIHEGATTILSTKLTIDNTERTSTTAAAACVISDTTIADDAEMHIDIDQVGDGTAKGLKVTIPYREVIA